ncbi:MAG: hypothetical protein FJ202_02815 [Gemmatimonadetes bacterium]|nr:hypothetical protein [Gemmatimonadota bacterium]
MEKHNAALGGRAALDKYSSMKISGTVNIAAMGLDATMEIFRAKPNKLVQRVVLGQFGEQLQGYDGKTGWAAPPMGQPPQILSGEALEAVIANADFFANFQAPENYSKAETVELVDFEGRKCYKVKVTRGTREGVEYFDAATGLLAAIVGTANTPAGPIEQTSVMLEYADFGGVKMPKRIEQRGGPAGAIMTVTAVEFDKVEPSAFEPPAAVKALIKP